MSGKFRLSRARPGPTGGSDEDRPGPRRRVLSVWIDAPAHRTNPVPTATVAGLTFDDMATRMKLRTCSWRFYRSRRTPSGQLADFLSHQSVFLFFFISFILPHFNLPFCQHVSRTQANSWKTYFSVLDRNTIKLKGHHQSTLSISLR